MRFSRPNPPEAKSIPEESGAVESGSDASAGKPESLDVLEQLAHAEREAEELLERRRRELEQAQAAEWERWTNEMESKVRVERERREQLEAALERTESARRELEDRVAQSERVLSEANALTEKRVAHSRREMEEARAGFDAKLTQTQTELSRSRGELEEVRGEMESKLQAARERQEQLEAALQSSESERRDLEGRIAESERLLAQTRGDTEKWVAQKRLEMEQTRTQFESKLALAHTQREQSQGQLAELQTELQEARARFEAELAQAQQDRDAARAELKPRSKRKVAEVTSRVGELERQLESEQHRREDLEVAVELLEKQHMAAVHRADEAERVAAEARAKDEQEQPALNDQPPESSDDPLKGWGVPIDKFPVVGSESEAGPAQAEPGSDGAVEAGRRGILRRKSLRDRNPGRAV